MAAAKSPIASQKKMLREVVQVCRLEYAMSVTDAELYPALVIIEMLLLECHCPEECRVLA